MKLDDLEVQSQIILVDVMRTLTHEESDKPGYSTDLKIGAQLTLTTLPGKNKESGHYEEIMLPLNLIYRLKLNGIPRGNVTIDPAWKQKSAALHIMC